MITFHIYGQQHALLRTKFWRSLAEALACFIHLEHVDRILFLIAFVHFRHADAAASHFIRNVNEAAVAVE